MGGLLWVFVAAMAPAGVALDPVTGAGQVPIVSNGNAILTTEDEHVRIAVALLGHRNLQPGGRAELVVYVVNQGAAAFEFGPEAVQVRTVGGELVRVERAEIDAEIRRLANKARFDVKLERSKDATSTLPTYFSGSLNNQANAPHAGPSGAYAGSNARSASEADAGKGTRTSIKAQREEIDAWESQALASVERLALHEGPIAPGGNAYGHVFVVLPNEVVEPVPLTLEVDAGGRSYSFALQAIPTGY